MRVGPHETLFSVGDSSAPGIFIVVEGGLGVYLQDGGQRLQTNVLQVGETVGDLDVLDGATRSMTCIATEEGALLTQVSRDLFVAFIVGKPRTLQIYLHKVSSHALAFNLACARCGFVHTKLVSRRVWAGVYASTHTAKDTWLCRRSRACGGWRTSR